MQGGQQQTNIGGEQQTKVKSHEHLLPSQEVGPTKEALAPVIQSATPKLEPVTHSAGGRLPFNIIPVLQVLFL